MKRLSIRSLAWASLGCAGISGCALTGAKPNPKGTLQKPDYIEKISMAQLLERQGQFDKAMPIYRDLVKRYPEAGEPYHRIAMIAVQQDKKDDAERDFQEALKRAPRDVELLNDYGYWLYVNNHLEAAETRLRAALEIDPEHKTACNNLGMVVGRRGRFDEGLELFRKIGSEADAQANLAYIHVQLRQFDRARAHYQRSLELDPRNEAAAEALAQLATLTPHSPTAPVIPDGAVAPASTTPVAP